MKEILHVAHRIFKDSLTRNQSPIDYLNGLYGEQASVVVERFQLGYCDDSFVRQIPEESNFAAKQVGLLGRDDTAFFIHRLLFPIFTEDGRLAGFTGRATTPNPVVKYLNSPAVKGVFEKSRLFFNLFDAIPYIQERGFVAITEGPTDVIAGALFGNLPNIVGTNGTALTSEHISILSQYTNKFLLCFDGDDAGMKATTKSYLKIKSTLPDAQIQVIALPYGYDLDQAIRQGINVLTRVIDIKRHRTMEYLHKINTSSVEEIVRLIEMIREHVSSTDYAQWFHLSYLSQHGFSYEEVKSEFERR